MRDALDVARYFVCRVDRDAGDTISPLKLQKLVYYAQAWSLVLRGEPLFFQPIQAWPHGPVVYDVWNAYRDYKHTAIPQLDVCDLVDFTEDELDVLDEVWNAYGELSARQLENLTHSESPWIEARKGLDPSEKSQEVISHESMKSYYEKYVVED